MLARRLGRHVLHQHLASVRYGLQHRLASTRNAAALKQQRCRGRPTLSICAAGNGSGSAGENGAAPETPPALASSRCDSRCFATCVCVARARVRRRYAIRPVSAAAVMRRTSARALHQTQRWTCHRRRGALPPPPARRRTSVTRTAALMTWCCRALRICESAAPGMKMGHRRLTKHV